MGFSGGGGAGISSQQLALLNHIPKALLLNAINDLITNKNLSTTDPTFFNIIKDVFSDADGYNNTTDVINTTAGFFTDEYCNFYEIANQSNEFNGQQTSFTTRVTINTLNSCVKDCSTNIKSGTAGDVTSARIKYNYQDTTTEYSNIVTNNTNAYTGNLILTNPSPTKPVTSVEFQYQVDNALAHYFYSNSRVVTIIDNLIHQITEQTLNFAPTYAYVYIKNKTITGTGSVDASITFDGENYQTFVLENLTAITNTGTSMISKLNLNMGQNVGISKIKDYGIFLI